jgi:hypothetical protein
MACSRKRRLDVAGVSRQAADEDGDVAVAETVARERAECDAATAFDLGRTVGAVSNSTPELRSAASGRRLRRRVGEAAAFYPADRLRVESGRLAQHHRSVTATPSCSNVNHSLR